MVNLDLNEYTVIDNILTDLKLTPDKIELPIPAYYAKVNYTVMVMVAHCMAVGQNCKTSRPRFNSLVLFLEKRRGNRSSS
jgi:hypothetical protein